MSQSRELLATSMKKPTLGKIRLGDSPVHPNKFRPNGQGVGNLPGSLNPKTVVSENKSPMTKHDKMGKIVGV